MNLIPLLLVVVALAAAAESAKGTQACSHPKPDPVIGLLSQPAPDDLAQYGPNYIAASYVKWIESAGGRVVPVPWDAPAEVHAEMLASLNGLLLTGGDVDLTADGQGSAPAALVDPLTGEWTPFFKAGARLLDMAAQLNAAGWFFPVWGTCQGMQLMSLAAANQPDLLVPFTPDIYSIPLSLTHAAASSAFLGSRAPARIRSILTSQPVTVNHHSWGVSPSGYEAAIGLRTMYAALSMDRDETGAPFISTLEGRELPFTAVQWHPEKVLFEWPDEDINHFDDSILANGYPARHFVSLARCSPASLPDNPRPYLELIYTYSPVYTAPVAPYFRQTYFFDNWGV